MLYTRRMAPAGLRFLPGHLSRAAQGALLAAVQAGVEKAPLFTPTMPRTGAPLSVRMTNLGPLGWISDRDDGYRYSAVHPETGSPWPLMPESLLALWDDLTGYSAPPEACLVNFYQGMARMGLHRDADEAARDAPVLSVSLGDSAVFRIGGPTRTDPTKRLMIQSGDVLVMGGASRHCYHGVDRTLAGSSSLISGGGRINLTLRRVTLPALPAMSKDE
jgi:DNA oxidative demethylase